MPSTLAAPLPGPVAGFISSAGSGASRPPTRAASRWSCRSATPSTATRSSPRSTPSPSRRRPRGSSASGTFARIRKRLGRDRRLRRGLDEAPLRDHPGSGRSPHRRAPSSPTGSTCSSPSTPSTAPWASPASAGLMIRVTPSRVLRHGSTRADRRSIGRWTASAEGRTPSTPRRRPRCSTTPAARLPTLLDAAAALRDRGHGRRITFSAKVFIPLTTLCRDYCGYCTFRKDPGEPGAFTMTPDAGAGAGARGRAARRQGGALLPRRQAGGALPRAPRVPAPHGPPHHARLPPRRSARRCSRRPGCCRTPTRAS